MRLTTASGEDLWLAYGMNVHAGGSVDVVEHALEDTVLPLKERLKVEGEFGVALRFDRAAVDLLADDDARRALLRGILAGYELVPFTANGFVVGNFHALGLKEDVYRPTWRERERVDYTMALAEVMARLRGPGEVVSISTSPGTYKRFDEGPRVVQDVAHNLAFTARRLRGLEQSASTRVILGVEPEPLGLLETTDEVIAFWRGPLREAFGRDRGAMHHIGVCYDVCHQAVEHEDPVEAIEALKDEGIPVVKVQASSAIVVPDPTSEAARSALQRFDEPRWLHQVVMRTAGGRQRAGDLAEVLSGPDAALWRGAGSPWRVHFHVPVHREEAVPPLRTTRTVLEQALRRIAAGGVTNHLEIETYTWDALPPEARAESLVESLAREYEWVLSVLQSAGVKRKEAIAE